MSRRVNTLVIAAALALAAVVPQAADAASAKTRLKRRTMNVVRMERLGDRPDVRVKGKVRSWLSTRQQLVTVRLRRLPRDETLCLVDADNGDVLLSWENHASRFTLRWGTQTHAPGEGQTVVRDIGAVALIDEQNNILLHARLDDRGPGTGVDPAVDLSTGLPFDRGTRDGYVPPPVFDD